MARSPGVLGAEGRGERMETERSEDVRRQRWIKFIMS